MTARIREPKPRFENLWRGFYNAAFVLYALAYLPFFFIKGKHRFGLGERLGRFQPDFASGTGDLIWVHAASVGEAQIACHLIRRARERFGACRFLLTTVTASGREVALRQLNGGAALGFLPLDLSGIVKGFVERINPRLVVLIETELWPNLLLELKSRGTPVLIANARLSNKSFGSYRRMRWFLKAPLEAVSMCLAQSAENAYRFGQIGLAAHRIDVAGNIKYDLEPAGHVSVPESVQAFTRYLGANACPMFLCVSTHPGEEALCAQAWQAARRTLPRLRLVLAPRHLERLDEVQTILRKRGFKVCRVSSLSAPEAGEDSVVLVDIWGVLNAFIEASQAVLVGGSLVPRGGHNLVEPAFHSKPVLHGPHMENFAEMRQAFRRAGASLEVEGVADLEAKLISLFSDETLRSVLGAKAFAVAQSQKGATDRVLNKMEFFLSPERNRRPHGS